MLLDQRQGLVDRDAAAELGRQRRNVGVRDPAGDDAVEPREVVVAVEREAVMVCRARSARRPPRPSSRRPLRGSAGTHPAASLDPHGPQAEVRAHVDQRALEGPDVRDEVDRERQRDDRVRDELAGTVPGDPPATVDVDDGRSVERALPVLGAPTGGVDRRVLQQQDGVGDVFRERAACRRRWVSQASS